uniref:Ionotropic glutamate receptor C-terminal domain-containing protein n=1 Tax=Cannabis sativa TaxID=3483 RepID=A0A803NFK1_CANSA
MQAHFIIELGNKAQIPIITFSAKSPSLTSLRSPYFFRIAANDSSQVEAIAAIVKAFGWRQVVPIYVDNEFGEGIIPYLTDALQNVDAQVPYQSVIPPTATDDHISGELYKLMTMQTRVFVLHMLADLGHRVFAIAEKIMIGDDYVWIVTDGIAVGSANSTVLDSMQGVLGLKIHVPKTKELQNFTARWRPQFQRENPTNVNYPLVTFGLWAYDAVFGLAESVEEIGKASNFSFESVNLVNSSTDLGSFGVSRSGSKLAQALSKTRFKGLSGEFKLVNGQLQTPTFEIINVNGNGERKIGFWTVENGLERVLAPKGWQIPVNGKKLRIGVPAVMEALPYPVSFEFVPFADASGNYNHLLYQVFDGKLDAAVGDITIRANRSLYVDFTLPYTESGVYMIVPIKDDRSYNAWAFLKPLTWDLWVTSGCFFIFIGFVVWVLEHRVNEEFRGPPHHQIGTSFWYSFSTMIFAHKEKVVSNLGRFVVIIWCFVVLILSQSYTASLTSLLTVQKLQPTITDVNQLLKNKEKVAFQKGSFIEEILKQMGFEDHQFMIYNTPEDLYQLFENRSKKNGISAAFDETPYIKVFLAKYCSKFTLVEPIFKADGFAFAFPKGSPLVPDISRAILKVTEGKKMKDLEEAWFKKDTNCMFSSNSLGLESFWGLFLMSHLFGGELSLFLKHSTKGISARTLLNRMKWEQELSSQKRNGTQPTDQETVVISAVELTCPKQDSRENHNF